MAKRKSKVIPRKIAGVKVPKTLRKPMNRLARTPLGQQIVAGAIVAAGAAALRSPVAKRLYAEAREEAAKLALIATGAAQRVGRSAQAALHEAAGPAETPAPREKRAKGDGAPRPAQRELEEAARH